MQLSELLLRSHGFGTAYGTIILIHLSEESTRAREGGHALECMEPRGYCSFRLFCAPIAGMELLLLVKILDSRNDEQRQPQSGEAGKKREHGLRICRVPVTEFRTRPSRIRPVVRPPKARGVMAM